MELFLSNYQPAKFASKTFKDFFEKSLSEAEMVRIASGYISTASLTELKKIVQDNARPKVELLIGMHYFEGFTKTQYQAAIGLSNFLTSSGLGSVYVSTAFKFHGKLYSFLKEKSAYAAVVGSSNMGSLFDQTERLYEADLLIDEVKLAGQIDSVITKLQGSISENISKIKIEKFKEFNPLLDNHDRVEKTEKETLENIFESKSKIQFEIPIKADEAPKSSLNVFFGKGRENQRGFILPRPWYEVELIVPSEITQKKSYPANKEFEVYTDDGWHFRCKTSGDYSKNFRSQDDLKILGKWIKGRLEQSGALTVGEPVTDNVLKKYGRSSFSLIGTSNPNVWLLNFKV